MGLDSNSSQNQIHNQNQNKNTNLNSDLNLNSNPNSNPNSKLEHISSLYRNIPEPLSRLLQSRGFTDLESWDELFRPSLNNLKSPFLLDSMDVLVDRLLKVYSNQEGLLVYGDFDLDGSSGAALLYKGLQSLGFENLHVIQPKRLQDGYGVHAHILERYIGKIKVVLTVDVGITAVEATEYANQNGIDMLITDHHLPKEILPSAYAIVNPNKGFCQSELGHLCGAGVGYYVLLGTWIKLKEMGLNNPKALSEDKISKIKNFDPKSLLDLFVIGTITDLVPLVRENRVLVKHGFKILERTPRKGLRALMQSQGVLGKKLGAQDIGFKIAPKLNSLSRMDKGLLPIDVFLCDDDSLAQHMVDQILSLNSDRLKHQKQAEHIAIEKCFDSEESYCFVCDESFHKGVVGLVATRLSQVYKKPAFVGEIKQGQISGSARIPKNSTLNLVDILSLCPSLKAFGGHAQAAGFQLELDKVLDFENELKSYFLNINSDAMNGLTLTKEDSNSSAKQVKFDLELKISEFSDQLVHWIEKLEPFGVGFEHPTFKIAGAFIKDHRILSGGHLKFKVSQDHHYLDCIWFNHELTALELESCSGLSVDIYGQIEFNEYLGQKKLQFLVHDLKTRS